MRGALSWVTRQVIEQIFGFVKSYRWFCSKLKLGWKYDLLSCFAETALETIQLHLLGGFSWVCDLWILKILCSQLSQILPSSGLVWTEGPCQHASASAALWLQLCYLREVGSVSNFQEKRIFWELKKKKNFKELGLTLHFVLFWTLWKDVWERCKFVRELEAIRVSLWGWSLREFCVIRTSGMHGPRDSKVDRLVC